MSQQAQPNSVRGIGWKKFNLPDHDSQNYWNQNNHNIGTYVGKITSSYVANYYVKITTKKKFDLKYSLIPKKSPFGEVVYFFSFQVPNTKGSKLKLSKINSSKYIIKIENSCKK